MSALDKLGHDIVLYLVASPSSSFNCEGEEVVALGVDRVSP